MEKALEELKVAVAQEGVDNLLADLPPEEDSPKPCPFCGKAIPVHARGRKRTFEALSGKHTIYRNYHYCKSCKVGFYPHDDALGLPKEGSVSFNLEERLLDFAVTEVYDQCAERWEVHYPHRPFSENMFRLTTDRVGHRLEIASQPLVHQEFLRPTTGRRDLLYVFNDGSMLPHADGTWKEAKVGVIVDAEDHTSGTQTQRGHVGAARYVGVWGQQEEFKKSMKHALDAQRWQRYEKVVWLGDGLRANWVLAETVCPTAIQILDIIHAKENGSDCGKVLLGEGDCLLANWKKRVDQLVDAGDVNALVGELMDCLPETNTDAQVGALDALVRYYRTNEERMDYPFYRSQGWMVGTGPGESAHRHVLQVRMKRAGQHWSDLHGRRMVRLRCAYRTAGAKRFHTAINRAAARTYATKQREQVAPVN